MKNKEIKLAEIKKHNPKLYQDVLKRKKITEISDKIPGKLAIEIKYDGERVQVHRNKNKGVILYS